MPNEGWTEFLGERLGTAADALGIQKLLGSFVDLANENFLLAFAALLVAIYYVMFRLVLPFYQIGRSSEPASRSARRRGIIHLSGLLLFGVLVSASLVSFVSQADIPKLTLPTTNLALGVDNLLQWERPKGFEGRMIEYEVQSSPDKAFRKVQTERTGDNVLPLFAEDNRVRYWRIRMLVAENSDGPWKRGRWSDPVRIEQYQDGFSRIRETGEVRVAISNTYGRSWFRFYLREQDPRNCARPIVTNTGFDIMLARTIAERLERFVGRKVVHTLMPLEWGDVLSSVGKGNADLAISAITITRQREREHGIQFSTPYYHTGHALVFKRPQMTANGAMHEPARGVRNHFVGKRIGLHTGTSSHHCLMALNKILSNGNTQAFEIQEYDNEIVALHEVARMGARIDHVVTDEIFAAGWSTIYNQQKPQQAVGYGLLSREDFLMPDGTLAQGTGDECWSQDYGIAVRAGDERLQSAVNQILSDIGPGGLKSLEDQARTKFQHYIASHAAQGQPQESAASTSCQPD